MATYHLRLPDDELKALREAAVARGLSMNEVAREGVRAVTTGAAREGEGARTDERRHVRARGRIRRLGDA